MLKDGKLSIIDSCKREVGLRVLVSGDFCPLDRTEKLVLQGEAETIFAEYKRITDKADLAFTNLEAPLTKANTPIIKTGPNLKVDPLCVDLIKEAGFNIIGLANNHMGDFGSNPVKQTIDTLKNNKLIPVGAGANLKEARKSLKLTHNEISIAILNYAENEFGGASSSKPGFSTLDPLVNIEEIRDAATGADVVLVFVHGGNEGNPLPSPRIQKTYRAFVDAGASAVIGGHTHCPQGIEVWNNAPIIYSLGNLIFDHSFIGPGYDSSDFWWLGYSVMLSFDNSGALGLEVIAHSFGPDAKKVNLLNGVAYTHFCQYLNKISKMIVDDRAMMRNWEAWCSQKGIELTPFLSELVFPLKSKKHLINAMVVRNTYTCETHHETLSTFFRLIEENRLEEANKYWNWVESLSTVPASLADLL